MKVEITVVSTRRFLAALRELEKRPVLATIVDVLGDGRLLTTQEIIKRTYGKFAPASADRSIQMGIARLRRQFGFNIVNDNKRGYRLERRSA